MNVVVGPVDCGEKPSNNSVLKPAFSVGKHRAKVRKSGWKTREVFHKDKACKQLSVQKSCSLPQGANRFPTVCTQALRIQPFLNA